MSLLDSAVTIVRVLFAAFIPVCFLAVLVWMERRGCGFIQDRSGPNRANIFGFRLAGIVQNLADGLKLAFKEDVIPGHIKYKFYYILAPVLVFSIAIISFAAVPFADALVLNGKTYLMQGIPLIWVFSGFSPLSALLYTASSWLVGLRTTNTACWAVCAQLPRSSVMKSRWALRSSACSSSMERSI